jgi:hypothetical protein
MAKYPLWLQATGGDPAINYAGADDRELIDAIWPYQGVINADGWVCQTRGAGANFSVDITAGRGIINGTTSATQGKFLAKTTGTVNLLTPSAPTSGSPRMHKVVAEILDKQAAGTLYGWQFHLIEDTIGGTLPATPASAIALAMVQESVGQVSNASSNIQDLRPMAQMAGAWNGYTPTWTMATLGASSSFGRYRRIGTSCLVQATLLGGSGTSMGNGDIHFTLPFPVQSANTPNFAITGQLSGNETFLGRGMLSASLHGIQYPLDACAFPGGTTCRLWARDANNWSDNINPGAIGAGSGTQALPWLSGSVMNAQIEYECGV